MIITYTEQLKRLAAEEQVDLYDAVVHAGVNRSTYHRAIHEGRDLQRLTAESIAHAIKELSAR